MRKETIIGGQHFGVNHSDRDLLAFELDEVDSTQEAIRRLLIEDTTLKAEFFYVWARTQTNGRGTFGRHWQSVSGNLNLSVYWPLKFESTEAISIIPLLVGIALLRCLRSAGAPGTGFWIKWPNDLWHNSQKLAGILCERIETGIIIGVGMNLSNEPVLENITATSLKKCAEDLNISGISFEAAVWAPRLVTQIFAVLTSTNRNEDGSSFQILKEHQSSFLPPLGIEHLGRWYYQGQEVQLLNLNRDGSFRIASIINKKIADIWSSGLEFRTFKS